MWWSSRYALWYLRVEPTYRVLILTVVISVQSVLTIAFFLKKKRKKRKHLYLPVFFLITWFLLKNLCSWYATIVEERKTSLKIKVHVIAAFNGTKNRIVEERKVRSVCQCADLLKFGRSKRLNAFWWWRTIWRMSRYLRLARSYNTYRDRHTLPHTHKHTHKYIYIYIYIYI